jgi:hypothetical protein
MGAGWVPVWETAPGAILPSLVVRVLRSVPFPSGRSDSRKLRVALDRSRPTPCYRPFRAAPVGREELRRPSLYLSQRENMIASGIRTYGLGVATRPQTGRGVERSPRCRVGTYP